MLPDPSGEGSGAHSSSQLAYRPGQARQEPNQTAFPPPIGQLPSPKRAAPTFNLKIFNDTTQPIPKVAADANSRENVPDEYVTSNSLRTHYGSSGKGIRVTTNYIEVKKAPPKLFAYTVSIQLAEKAQSTPASKEQPQRRGELKRVFDSLKNRYPLQSRTDWSTDLMNIWSVHRLFDGEELILSNVAYFKQNGRLTSVPRVTFKFDGELDLSRGHLDLIEAKTTAGSTDAGMKARALNGIVSNFMTLSTSTPITQVGANRFFLTDAFEELGPFITLRGYFSSIRPGNDRILLNVNTTTSAFFKPILLSQFFQAMLKHGMKEWMIKGMLRKQVVRITYGRSVDLDREEARKKRIMGFGDTPQRQTFQIGKENKTVFDYFKGGSQPGKEQWIPAEFLEIDFPQLYKAILPSVFTNDMMKFALRGPAANANLIVNEGLVHLGIKDSTTTSDQSISKKLNLEGIGFDIDDKLIDIDARILDSPKVQYSATEAIDKKDPRLVTPRSAAWNLVDPRKRKQPFAASSTLPRVGILTLRSSQANPRQLAEALSKVLIEHGVKVMSKSPWSMTISPSPDKDGSYVASMKDAIAKVEKEMMNNGITMVLLPQQDLDLYAALKTVCDAKGLPTICSAVNPNRLLNEQTLSNIALKFSLKTGGRPHQISGGLSHVTSDTMIMGADVTHPAADARAHCPSVAAAVGSFDGFAVNYTGSMRLQKNRQEVIEDMNGMATELLNMYGRHNKRLPSSIVYYRDGVSEAQYDSIRQLEVMAIEKAWMALKESGKPSTEPAVKITCMVVGKRHHTRFFPKRQYDADQSNNVKPGLVVDSVITHPYCFDFFLQSHAAVKGTARSAHYFLLRNDLKLGADELQKLTHDLCYTYGVATKGISYCAPAYLADKLCDRGRCYIRDWLLGRPSSSLTIPSYSKDLAPTVQDYERVLARRLNISKPFNNWETEDGGKYKGRKSPWHPSLDYRMFWV
ncbi:hypothetical protein SLS58_002293 [Diplodia intermedia]|uniref:Piwi domain-containing protein n=1 Tax=Diplodia intermedia TaxID=856260 RepID=A0ABR3TZ88_9PEZI